MKAYTVLSKYYDRLMGDFDYSGYVQKILSSLKGEGIDLCCGSGKITLALAKNGCKMTGVDLSADMLNAARERSKKAAQNILWINQDCAEFEPAHPVDFVTCVCDGFNYLSPDELKETLKKIATYVKAGGSLIFDISSEHKLETVLGDNMFCEDHEDITYIWSNTYDPDEKSLEMQISFFELNKGDMYRRIDEGHLQYAHAQSDIEDILSSEWDIRALDGETYSKVRNSSKRILFIATRK